MLDSMGGPTCIGPEFDCSGTLIAAAEADYICGNVMVDMKVSKCPPRKEHTLQLAIYCVLAHKTNPEIDSICVANPRLGKAWACPLDREVIERVAREVVGI